MTRFLQLITITTGIAAGLAACGCDAQVGAGDERTKGAAAPSGTAPVDAPLAPSRLELLDLAFDTASAIPLEPHIKDRSKMQELVVTTSLALDQPQRARRLAEEIADWRRGVCYADYADYCARHDFGAEAEAIIEEAAAVAQTAQDWRRDTIRAKIAQVLLRLGDPKRAAQFDTGLTESETGKSHAVRAQVISEELFSAQVEALDHLAATEVFDKVRNALDAFAVLFDRFYADEEKRTLAEDRIRASWSMFPHLIRIELLRTLTDAALAYDDKTTALAFLNETQALIDELNWKAEYRVPLLAHLARQQFLAGDVEGAQHAAEQSLAVFESGRESIVNIYRAAGLRPLAEAHVTMGDMTAARAVYALALEEGVVNPNSRPRAEDLCATLCSMAMQGFEPDEALWQRMREIRRGLDHPW